ncbi:NAD-dependent epimerase/dehydratase family protein [Candidatus Berkelbacteria bacterium]|nr:NAD-dependent epimerase/dehydratase family protein [Candidatus Berkelbacteria bacterium]
MKILVTGGAGFIGSNLVDRLISDGHKVLVLDNLSVGREDFFKQHQKNPHFQFEKIDLLEQEKLKNIIPPDVELVYHLVANSDISKGIQGPQIDFDNTILATYNLLTAMKERGVKKIFFLSGSGVYGDRGEQVLAENFGPLMPNSMYGASKLSAEALIYAFAHFYDWQVWILRPANIIGPRLTHGVIFDFIKRLKKNPRELEILGDGQQSKSYLYVLDVIEAILQVFKKAQEKINLFNLSSSNFVTVNEIAQIVVEEMGLPAVKFKWTGGRGGWKGDVPVVRLDNQAIYQLGWQPKYTSKEAVRKTVKVLLGKESL